MRGVQRSRWIPALLAGLLAATACGSPASSGGPSFKGTRKIGLTTAITGQSALYGHAISQAARLAVDDLNAKGGVTGYKIAISILDDGTDVNKAVENAKELILQEQVVALFAPVTSAQCQGVTPITKQNRVLTVAAICNSYQLLTSPSLVNPYWVAVGPNTYMEGVAAGTDTGRRGIKNIFIVSPDYLFGRSETNAFVTAVRRTNPAVNILNQPSEWYVPLTTADWGPVIAKIQATRPDLIYSNIFAASQLGFIQKAKQTDPQFFQKFPMTTLASVDELQTLKDQYPLNMRLYSRAPFFALSNPRMDDLVTRYRARYANEYPSDWAVMEYDAIMIWAQAAKAAGSIESDKVRAQLVGHTFESVRGPQVSIRKEDQQGNVGETIGTTASSGGRYPFPTFADEVNLKGDDIMMPLELVMKLQAGQCRNDDFANC